MKVYFPMLKMGYEPGKSCVRHSDQAITRCESVDLIGPFVPGVLVTYQGGTSETFINLPVVICDLTEQMKEQVCQRPSTNALPKAGKLGQIPSPAAKLSASAPSAVSRMPAK